MEYLESFFFIYISIISAVTRGIASEVPSIHKRFTRKELAETFGADHHDNVPVYTSTGVRGPIKLKDNSETALSLKAFGKEFDFNVSANKNFIADTHTTEFVDAYGNITKYVGVHGEFSFGSVAGDPASHVALHHTGKGLSGSIRTSNDLYLISPLPYRFQNDEVNHVIYRASDNPNDPYIKKIIATEKEILDVLQVHRRSRRSTRDELPKKTIEIMVAGDWKMLEFYGREFLPTYMLVLINILAGYYRDVSLAYPVDLVVVRTAIFETDILKGKRLGDLLDRWSEWCNEHNNFDDTAEDHFDTGLLITRNGCSQGCGIVGLARLDAVCNAHRSHAVALDKGFMTTVILAHELGHVLNARHDGRKDSDTGKIPCPNDINIMASGGTYGGPQALKFSPCSSKTIEETMRSPRSSCFDDVPPKKLTDSTFQLYGTKFDSDKQCAYTYGRKYQRCIFKEDLCNAMSCNEKGTMSCTTKFFPALHGTSCGQGKWCIGSLCVPNGRKMKSTPRKVHGGWSSWSEYTDCNKLCNVGVMWKVRKCNNPKPANGGSLCKSEDGKLESEENGYFTTCNEQNCDKGTPSEQSFMSDRDKQCGAITSGNIFCQYCPDSDPCALWCGQRYGGTLDGKVSDGTPCKTNKKMHGICMADKCNEIGCDHMLNSGEGIDRCGVCKGDGSSCGPVKGSAPVTFSSQGKFGAFLITTIPVGAKDAVIQEGARTANFLSIKIGDSSSYAIPPFTRGKNINLDGATISYRMTGFPNQDKIVIKGTLKVPVHVYYINKYYRSPGRGVNWSYTQTGGDKGNKTKVTVEWVVEEFGECSKSCAGGIKRRRITCRRQDDKTSAGVKVCTSQKEAPAATAECGMGNCPARWEISDWGECSLSCATGIHTRQISCVAWSRKGDVVVAESLCTEAKPTDATSKKCNDVSCPAYWDCSESCKEVVCERLDKNQKLITVPELECVALNKTKPATEEKCKVDPKCKTKDIYQWQKRSQNCAIGCGKGNNIIEISCHDAKTGRKVDHKHCAKLKTPEIDCKRNCQPVSKDMPNIQPVGCFKDTPSDPRVPQFYASFKSTFLKSDPRPTIKMCAEAAKSANFTFFALQSYGDCWIGSDSTVKTYDTAGKSTHCTSGTGKEDVNYVFHIGKKPIVVKNLPPVVNIGCLITKDSEDTDPKLSTTFWLRRMVPYCGTDAYRDDHEYFGGDSEGNCLVKETIEQAMKSPEFSPTCVPETVGMSQYHIFTFVDTTSSHV